MEDNTTSTDPNWNESLDAMGIVIVEEDGLGHIRLGNILIGSGLVLLVFTTIVGNSMILTAVFIEKSLQTTFNFYLVNLAIADLAVAVTAMSFYSVSTLLGYWPFGEFMCGVWIFFDYGMTFVSVFTLLLISIDRFWSITWFIHYRQHHTDKTCLLSIAGAWLLMLLIWLPACTIDRMQNGMPGVCKWEPSLNPIFVIIVAILGHHGSCLILIFCYVRVYLFMRNKRTLSATKRPPVAFSSVNPTLMIATVSYSEHIHKPIPTSSENIGEKKGESHSELKQYNKQTCASLTEERKTRTSRHRRDANVFITLTYIVVAYVICWVPFHFVFDISCIKDSLVPENAFTITFLMTYMNSTINPILYTISNKEFRSAFRRILSRRH